MRKFSTTIGALVVLALTFSLGHLVGAQTRPGHLGPSATNAAPDVYAVMVQIGKSLPTDQWSEPF